MFWLEGSLHPHQIYILGPVWARRGKTQTYNATRIKAKMIESAGNFEKISFLEKMDILEEGSI